LKYIQGYFLIEFSHLLLGIEISIISSKCLKQQVCTEIERKIEIEIGFSLAYFKGSSYEW